MTDETIKHVKGDGINTPDLKLFAGAYVTITYWQAAPDNNHQATIYVQNDNQPDNNPLIVSPDAVGSLAQALSFIDHEIG